MISKRDIEILKTTIVLGVPIILHNKIIQKQLDDKTKSIIQLGKYLGGTLKIKKV